MAALTKEQRLAGLSPELAQRAQAIARDLQDRRVADAERGVIAALALAPKHAEILRLFGATELMRGRAANAIEPLLKSGRQRPGDETVWNFLSAAYDAIGDMENAVRALRRACSLAPDSAALWFNLGRMLFSNGDIEEANGALRRAVELQPAHPHARTMLAGNLTQNGKPDQAEALYREVLARYPAFGPAWWGLATIRPTRLDRGDIAKMERALGDTQLADGDRISLHFALGNAREAAGDFAGALDALQTGHALARRTDTWDAHTFVKRVDRVLEIFYALPAPVDAEQGGEVIFIVSMPRSGSTLLEQVLASHAEVEGTTELPMVLRIVMDESDHHRQTFPEWVGGESAERWHQLGRAYLAATERWRRHRPRFTDKMPGNWLYVGAILRMLPRARVIVMRRDPLETSLACYRYMFRHHAYTHDFGDLAIAWRGFDRACRRWKELHPERVHEQAYEDLVADPERQIRRLLDFCGLPFEENCLNFHATERRVTTPSASQVREPMRRDTARAGKYGALLDPLRAALGMPPWSPG